MPEKKKTNTKKNSNKGKKVVVKKVENKSKADWKEFFRSTPFLIGVFVGLIVLIVFLGVCIHQKEQKKIEEFDAHITIPVLKTDANFEFGVDALLLTKEYNKEYIFKITNFRNDQKAEEEVPFQIVIENDTKATISLTKGDSEDELITDQKRTVIEEVMPLSEEEEAIYYHLKIASSGKLKKDQFIQIQILS